MPAPPPEQQQLRNAVQELQQRAASERQVGKNFSVEAQQPTTWLDTFKQVQQGELPRRAFTLGKVETNDDVSSNVRCAVRVAGEEKDDKVSYTLGARISYSDARLQKDGGFHTTGEAIKIANILKERGIKVKFETNVEGQQILSLEKDEVKCIANLGWTTAKEMPQVTPPPRGPFDYTNIPNIGGLAGRPPSFSEGFPPSEPPRRNEPLDFILWDAKSSDVIQVQNPEELAKQVVGFSGMLGEFVNAYYASRGVASQADALRQMQLKIPSWETYTADDDADLANRAFTRDRFDPFGFMKNPDTAEDIGYVLTEQEKASMPTFAEVGGQPQAVEEARKLVMSLKNAEVFAKRGVDRPRGILLKGPPGTGKTLLAKAIAREAGADFMSLSVTDLVSKWFGEAEKRVQGFFDQAKKLTDEGKDLIVFVDELDSVVPQREGAHEATQKMVAVFLQNMDGLKSNPHMTMIAATNNPEKIDPAFLRPGRLDKKIEVGLPDAAGRAEILGIHLKKHTERAADPTTLISPQLNPLELATTLGKVSGAEIAAIVNFALEEKTAAEVRYLEGDTKNGRPWTPLTAEDLTASMIKRLRQEGWVLPDLQ